jgi:hypothetical protein
MNRVTSGSIERASSGKPCNSRARSPLPPSNAAKRSRGSRQQRLLAALRMTHHRAVAVVDLAFLTGRRDEHGVRGRTARGAQRAHEAAHACVAGRESVAIDKVLRDPHRVPSAADRLLDELAVRLAGARLWAPGPSGRSRKSKPGRSWHSDGTRTGETQSHPPESNRRPAA